VMSRGDSYENGKSKGKMYPPQKRDQEASRKRIPLNYPTSEGLRSISDSLIKTLNLKKKEIPAPIRWS